jgi:hypothetical protein
VSTTGKNYGAITTAAGSGLGANGAILALPPATAASLATSGNLTILDKFTVDVSKNTAATKTAGFLLKLAASTPVTVDLTNLGALAISAGDTSFATWLEVNFNNLGTQDVKVTPGASNPANTPLSGTTPGFTVYASSFER